VLCCRGSGGAPFVSPIFASSFEDMDWRGDFERSELKGFKDFMEALIEGTGISVAIAGEVSTSGNGVNAVGM
jgi:hypothetical protein